MTKPQQTFYLQVSLKGLGYLMKEIGNRKFRFNRNLPSATKKVDILKQKNSKEVTAGRASGPFDEPPFPIFKYLPWD
jgi:hypothetical protein